MASCREGAVPRSIPTLTYRYLPRWGYARNIIVVHSGEACIAIGGAFGTLSEIGYAMDAKIPVVALNTWELTVKGDGDPIVDGMIPASDPADAVNKAMEAARNAAGIIV